MNCRFVFKLSELPKPKKKKKKKKLTVILLLIFLEETNLRVDRRLFCPKTTVTRLGETVPV